jgi:2-oxoglutarate ferredoxin oxidoreductase subunit beta
MEAGEIREVALHDGSIVVLKNLEKGYDPSNRLEAMRAMEEARQNSWLITGLLYVNADKPNLTEMYDLVDTPLNRLTEADLRPDHSMMDKVNALMF